MALICAAVSTATTTIRGGRARNGREDLSMAVGNGRLSTALPFASLTRFNVVLVLAVGRRARPAAVRTALPAVPEATITQTTISQTKTYMASVRTRIAAELARGFVVTLTEHAYATTDAVSGRLGTTVRRYAHAVQR